MSTAQAAPQRARASASRSVDIRYRWPSRYLLGWVALAVALVLVALVQPDTYSAASRELVTALAGILIVASLGQLLVVMVGAIDLSVPGYLTLSAAINVHFVDSQGPLKSFLLAVVVCMALSAVSGAVITLLRMNALIVTLAMNTVIAGGLILWVGQTFSPSGFAPSWLRSIARADVANISAIFLAALALALVLSLAVHRTRGGRQVTAIGDNSAAARLLGIRVDTVYIGTFAVAGLMYALAGALAAGLVQQPDSTLGDPYQITTLTGVAIAGATFGGGPASISPLVAACTLLPLLDQSLSLANLSPGLRVVIQGALLVIAVAAGGLSKRGRADLKRLLALGSSRPSARGSTSRP